MSTEPRTYHRYLAAFALPLLTTLAAPGLAQSAPRPAASLAATYRNDFLIGVATDFVSQSNLSADDITLIKSQFNVITPENSMKPDSVHPAEDRWTWTNADKLVAFCQENKIQLVGHCLVWHGQTGRWFFQGENGQPVTRETAIERMRQHIHTEVGRYKGKIKGWDVVNEAIADGGPDVLRDSPWRRILGEDFLDHAFRFAREADPKAELYYNDYGLENEQKRARALTMLRGLIQRGVPIDGVGLQGHYHLDHPSAATIEQTIKDFAALGLKVPVRAIQRILRGLGQAEGCKRCCGGLDCGAGGLKGAHALRHGFIIAPVGNGFAPAHAAAFLQFHQQHISLRL